MSKNTSEMSKIAPHKPRQQINFVLIKNKKVILLYIPLINLHS